MAVRAFGGAALAVAVAVLAGCAEAGAPATGTPVTAPEPAEMSAETTVATLGGLVVTVQTTSGPGPNIFEPPNASNNETPPAPGMSRLTLISRARNSGDTSLAVQIEHNFPGVTDSTGAYVSTVGGALHATNAGSKFDPEGERLRPGGVLTTVVYLDVTPAQFPLTMTWDFGDLGTATATLPAVR